MIRAASFLAALLLAVPAFAQVACNQGLEPIDRQADSRMTALDFIKDVAGNESVFTKASANFGYTLSVELKTLQDSTADGEYRRVTRVAFDGAGGGRQVTPVGDGVNTLKRFKAPAAGEIDGLREAFVIKPDMLADRDIVYSGRQKIDDFRAAVFDILPRNGQSAEKGFSGRVWVRVRDNAIARICGRVYEAPFGPMRYLVLRSKVADKYWFPVSITANEKVPANDDVRLSVDVKYSDYTSR